MVHTHVVLISVPFQGAINPIIQFAKNLKRMGVKVTILSSVSAQNRMAKASSSTPEGLTFVSFSDGYDDGLKLSDNIEHFRSENKLRGSKALSELIKARSEEGCPVTGVVYAMLLPWAAEVAREFNLPSAPLWIQPATIFTL
ncbi:UDP-glycosyltransferase 75C1 [Camellia lanceoleosa]|uniref:UDP-glycosyltransferase 75C1 n=1 Tax=Camellia lanceoleosa TaxID=1840588 RepID=A0ACC0GVH3_9ERIC|nr:UDP-glycosyltransferase 75C1 [Camellia lanceoleosa]